MWRNGTGTVEALAVREMGEDEEDEESEVSIVRLIWTCPAQPSPSAF